MKKALITGVTGLTGQDGSFLSEFLLEKGYDVHGMIRRSSVDYRQRIAHLEDDRHFHHFRSCQDMRAVRFLPYLSGICIRSAWKSRGGASVRIYPVSSIKQSAYIRLEILI